MKGVIAAVSVSPVHALAKTPQTFIRVRAEWGVDGDAHAGVTIKHRSRVAKDPTQRNLRQIHFLHAELLDELRAQGFVIAAGQMGENVTTRGIDLLSLPERAQLYLGASVVVEVTGLRNPCSQLDRIQPGLMAATLSRDREGNLIRKAGIMGIVITGGDLAPGDTINVVMPPPPHRRLSPI